MSIDRHLLERIDRAAGGRGLWRSAYLAQLAARDVESAGGPGKDPAVRRALSHLDDLFTSGLGWGALQRLARALEQLSIREVQPDLERVATWTARGLTAYGAGLRRDGRGGSDPAHHSR